MKRILCLIDCQNDFIDGRLGVGYDKWITAYNNVIENELHSDKYDLVIATQDWHPSTHCSFVENGGQWPKHCVANTQGAELYWKIKGEMRRDNRMRITPLWKGQEPFLEEYGVDLAKTYANDEDETYELYFVGIAFDYCVAECARLTALRQNVKCFIIKDGCCVLDESRTPDFGNAKVIQDNI